MSKTYAGALCRWSLGLALVGGSAAHTAPSGSVAQKAPALQGKLNSFSYGYDLTCVVNGHDVGIKGGHFESRDQYVENSKDFDEVIPALRSQYAPLRIGHNTVKITYKRKLPAKPFGLEITYEVKGYPAPLFYANVGVDGKDSGTFEGAFDLAAQPPAGFKPLVLTESDPATSGLLYVSQDAGGDGFLIPTLNRDTLMQVFGVQEAVVPFSGLHSGANTLTIEYSTHRSPMHLYILGPKGASLHNLRSAKKAKATFVIQGPDPAAAKH